MKRLSTDEMNKLQQDILIDRRAFALPLLSRLDGIANFHHEYRTKFKSLVETV